MRVFVAEELVKTLCHHGEVAQPSRTQHHYVNERSLALRAGEFLGDDALCRPTGRAIGSSPGAQVVVRACPGSALHLAKDDVMAGPAPKGFTRWEIVKEANGNLSLQ